MRALLRTQFEEYELGRILPTPKGPTYVRLLNDRKVSEI
jgi:hypothetical protein